MINKSLEWSFHRNWGIWWLERSVHKSDIGMTVLLSLRADSTNKAYSENCLLFIKSAVFILSIIFIKKLIPLWCIFSIHIWVSTCKLSNGIQNIVYDLLRCFKNIVDNSLIGILNCVLFVFSIQLPLEELVSDFIWVLKYVMKY